MPRLSIRHESVYRFDQPVLFGRWRLLMRPLDTHATRLIEASLETPPSDIKWSYDAYGNCVCHLTPQSESDSLIVVSNLIVERYPSPLNAVRVEGECSASPILYSLADRAILEPYIVPATADDDPVFIDWLRGHLPDPGEPAVEFLQRFNRTIQREFSYGVRDAAGTQSPSETVRMGGGTCRDFAWLMIESLRRLGFAARFATGYLYSPGGNVQGAGATHAWCEVFLPEHGWIEFDPTNALVESFSLIRVAAARTFAEASPMSGSVNSSAPCRSQVKVEVDLVDP